MAGNCIYVFQIPSTIIWELCNILDPGGLWEQVAMIMPKIVDVDIDAIQRLKPGDEKPTEALLRIWGSKGYKINDLYKVFAKLKLVRCMRIIRQHVDPSLHKLEQNCAVIDEKNSIRPVTKTNSAIDNAHSLRPNDPPSLVYSKKVSSVTSSPSANHMHSEASSMSNSTFSGLQNTPSVKYTEILVATNDFASINILGKGGYGTVYKGFWKHTDVAIKRILSKKDGGSEHEKERLRQSLQELRTLAKFRHDNILALYGYSMDGPESCLVYQFMANGSLEDRLLCRQGTSPLSWLEKLNIAHGTSCGLHFLHSIGNAPIIHGDVKSANILLDKHMEPKLGDFGLARDGQVEADAHEKSPLIASHIKGTLAYLPPEFITSKILSTKLDVYSFGVVLLELATGLRAYSDARTPHSLVDYSLKIFNDSRGKWEIIMDLLIDKRSTKDKDDFKVFEQFVALGFNCSNKDRFLRPTFAELLKQFKNHSDDWVLIDGDNIKH